MNFENTPVKSPYPPSNGVGNHSGGLQRFTASFPCPICGGCDNDHRGAGERCWGFLSSDGEWAHCTREEHAGGIQLKPGSDTYPHKLKGKCKCGQEHGPPDPKPVRNGKGGQAKRPRKAADKPKYESCEPNYIYRDAEGTPVYGVYRAGAGDGKSFWLATYEAPGRWRRGLAKGIVPLPYRLPELLEALDKGEDVYVAEGEKDCDRIRAEGCGAATTNHSGTGNTDAAWSHIVTYFREREARVNVLGDNDATGREHADKVVKYLLPVAAVVRRVELPGLPEKGDVSDWFNLGHTSEELGSLTYHSPVIPFDTAPARLAQLPRTDLGNAERLVVRHGQDLRYCHPWKQWFVWDGRRWKCDNTAEARRRARDTVRGILAEAATVVDDAQRKALTEWALKSEGKTQIGAMLTLAEAENGVPVLPENLDSDPWLFNCRNGTLDLRTGQLRPHRRSDLIAKMCPVEYIPDAKCPLWLSTLDKFFHREDPAIQAELIGYWQRICGYALTGVVRDHILPVAYGTGSNGKSTILGALMDVFGPDYSMKAPPDMFMAKKTDSHPTDRADLFGKRLVVCIETEAGRRLNETLVKELTGGDAIRARRMREDFWEFKPTHTLIMATNHKPGIRGTDNGTWRRLRLIPFTVSVSGQEANKQAPEQLRSEAPGILAWCVRGCLEWQQAGLDPPAEVSEASDRYRAEQDLLGLFLEQCTVKGPGHKIKAVELYSAYKQWAETGSEYVTTQTVFGHAITERGIEKKTSNGVWYLGLDLKKDWSN